LRAIFDESFPALQALELGASEGAELGKSLCLIEKPK
jgi:hypothetical protein